MASSQRAQFKKTARHSAIYAVGTILRRITGLVMLPIYTRYLTPADYGVVELLTIAIELTGILIGLRISQALFRFYILEEDEVEKRRIVSTVLITIAVSSSIGAAALYYFAAPLTEIVFGSQEYVYESQLFAITLMTNAMIAVGLSYLRARQKPVLFVAIGLFSLLIQVLLNIYFVVYLELHVTGVVYGAVISGLILASGLTIYVISCVGISYSTSIANRLIRYVSPLILASLGAFYVAYADKYFLRVFGSLADVGLYALAARVSSVVMTAFEAFNMSWAADRFEVVKRDDAQSMFEQVFRFLCAGLFLTGAGLSIFANDFFRLMTTPDFYPASYLVPLFMLSLIARIFTVYNNFGALYRDRTSIMAQASWLRAAVATVGYLVLIPQYGVYGAVVALASSSIVEFLWVYRQSNRLYDMTLRWQSISMMFVITAAAVIVSLLLPEGDVTGVVSRSGIYLLLLLAFFLIPVWSDEERGVIRAGLYRFVTYPYTRLARR